MTKDVGSISYFFLSNVVRRVILGITYILINPHITRGHLKHLAAGNVLLFHLILRQFWSHSFIGARLWISEIFPYLHGAFSMLARTATAPASVQRCAFPGATSEKHLAHETNVLKLGSFNASSAIKISVWPYLIVSILCLPFVEIEMYNRCRSGTPDKPHQWKMPLWWC